MGVQTTGVKRFWTSEESMERERERERDQVHSEGSGMKPNLTEFRMMKIKGQN